MIGRPGPGQLITDAPPGLLIVELANTTATAAGRAERYVLIISTRLAAADTKPSGRGGGGGNGGGGGGGGGVEEFRVVWRGDVTRVHPIEPDPQQEGAPDNTGCSLNWNGPVSPVRLPGGGVQLVSYATGPTPHGGSRAADGGAGAGYRVPGRTRAPTPYAVPGP